MWASLSAQDYQAQPPQLATPASHEQGEIFDFENEFARAYQEVPDEPLPIVSLPEFEQTKSSARPVDTSEVARLPLQQPDDFAIAPNFLPGEAPLESTDKFASGEPNDGGLPAETENQSPPSPTPVPPSVEGLTRATAGTTWWRTLVRESLSTESTPREIDTNSLVLEAIKNSPRIQAISQTPLIRDLQVTEADAEFDPLSFVRSKFQDREDPVGNTLTTGGAPFLQDHIWSGEVGLQKKTRTGANVNLSEQLGFKNSNSNFFLPQDQGTATLSLNVSQPLMRGRGRYYNQSQILIAQATGGAAWDTFAAELQDELQDLTQNYWKLYYQRSVYLQKQRNVKRGAEILAILEGRSELDSLPNQLTRTRSSIQSRKTELANALRDVHNTETEIRRQIADREWLANQSVELIPSEIPNLDSLQLPLEQVVTTALENRREIQEVMKRAKVAGIQYDISTNELMPELSLMMGAYVSALRGESQIGRAIIDQFGQSTPGYHVGIDFEMPYRNRAAQSRQAQRKLQMIKIKAEVDESIQKVIAESQIALRRVDSALQTLAAAELAITAADADLEQNMRRWEVFGLLEGDLAEGQTPITMLDQVLNSQDRLVAAEMTYAGAELELKVAEISLQRAMGTLLMHDNVDFKKGQGDSASVVDIYQTP